VQGSLNNPEEIMDQQPEGAVKDGDQCRVVGGTHKGKAGVVRDLNVSKGGNLTITVVQADGERFKTLARNVVVEAGGK
jgi:ribosomal protein S4E